MGTHLPGGYRYRGGVIPCGTFVALSVGCLRREGMSPIGMRFRLEECLLIMEVVCDA